MRRVFITTLAVLGLNGLGLGAQCVQAGEQMLLHTKPSGPLGLTVAGKRLNLGASASSWQAALGPAKSHSAMPAGQVAWAYPQRGLRVIVQNRAVRGVGLVLDGRVVTAPPERGTGKSLPSALLGFQKAQFSTDEGLNGQSTVAQVKAVMGATNFEEFGHEESMRQLHFTRSFQGQATGARVLFRYVKQKMVEVVLTRW